MGVAPRKLVSKPEPSNLGSKFDPKAFAAAAGEIRTPYGIIALVVLICGSGVAVLMARAGPENWPLFAGGVFILLTLALTFGFVLARGPSSTSGVSHQLRTQGNQKTFMSAPMASLTGENYLRMKEKMRAIKASLKRDAGQAEVFWGGDSLDDPTQWDRPAEALRLTIERIRDCDNFLLVLPDYACAPHGEGFCKPSSIWWEAGIAIAFGKRCSFFIHETIRNHNRMPYYLRAMQTAEGNGIPASKLWDFESLTDIEKTIQDARENTFDQGRG